MMAGKAEAASKADGGQPSPIEVERDEFGLPIRKYVAPEVEETKDSDNDGQTSSSVPRIHKEPAADATDKPDNGGPDDVNKVKEQSKKVAAAESEGDGDKLQDAKSKSGSPAELSPAGKGSDEQQTDDDPPPSSIEKIEETSTSSTKNEDSTETKIETAGDDPNPVEKATKDDASGPTSATQPDETAKDTNLPAVEETPSTTTKPSGHQRDISTASVGGLNEYSHQKVDVKEDGNNSDDGWQEMPSYARYDMYNDDNKLIAREHDDAEDEKVQYNGLGGAGKGYTRVQMDEDAESATSMDDNTKYLFKNAAGTSMADGEDDEARDAISQMQATKDLLTEGQRIAYVGIVRLEIAEMIKEREAIVPPKKVKKEVTMAAEATKMWGQKMMIRLYAHMDISEAEQIMIEQLSEHGVLPADLTPALMTNARVHNPMAGQRVSEVFDEDTKEKTASSEEQSGDSPKEAEQTQQADEDSSKRDSTLPQYRDDDEAAAQPPPPYEFVGGDELPDVKTPSQLQKAEEIEIDLRWTILCDLFLILIADSVYDARSRTLLERVGKSLQITWLDICRFEKRVTEALEMQQAAEKENWNEDEHLESRRKRALKKRYMMMGLATVGGGLVIGLSAGLMAPLIGAGLAAGFTTIGIGGTTGFLAGAGGAAIITTTAATSGGIVGVRAANRRTGAVKTFEYRPLHNNKRMNLVVTVSGWLTGKMDDVRLPFSTVDPIIGDIYSILWEPDMLRSMGDTINILATEALTSGLQQVLGNTILVGLMAALQLPVILSKLSYLIDNPWAVSLDRAWSAGQILADSLIERSLGTRPITLVGYSIGARVVYSCLLELAKKGAYGLVQGVYLFGTPVVFNKEDYLKAKSVVSGRFVNGYHNNDWILGYLFRLTNGGIRRVAGLTTISEIEGIENVDATDIVKGHMQYRTAMPLLLQRCGWPVESEEFTEIEEPDPENHDQRQRELINEIEEARRKLEEDGKAGQKSGKFTLFGRKKKIEKQDWEVYQEKGGTGLDGDKQEGGDGKESSNHGVLFDVDAIRAELAKEGMGYGNVGDELQIKEIKSTLPPMRIEVTPNTSPSAAKLPSRPMSLRGGTQSADILPPRHSYSQSQSTRGSYDRTTRSGSPSFFGTPSPAARRSPAPTPAPVEDEIQMTFDTSFNDDDNDYRRRDAVSTPPLKHDHDAFHTSSSSTSGRPEMKSTQTLPNITLTDPWADPDDDDFGKEKEMTMTFA